MARTHPSLLLIFRDSSRASRCRRESGYAGASFARQRVVRLTPARLQRGGDRRKSRTALRRQQPGCPAPHRRDSPAQWQRRRPIRRGKMVATTPRTTEHRAEEGCSRDRNSARRSRRRAISAPGSRQGKRSRTSCACLRPSGGASSTTGRHLSPRLGPDRSAVEAILPCSPRAGRYIVRSGSSASSAHRGDGGA
jgi:hypothetical protein